MNSKMWGIIGGVALVLALLSPLVLGNVKKVQRLFDAGEVLYEHSDYKGAIAKYSEALKESKKFGVKTETIDKDFPTLANLKIARCYYELAENTSDVRYYRTALTYITQVALTTQVVKYQEELTYLWAEILYKTRDLEGAKTKFLDLIKKFPKSRWVPNAWYAIGDIHYQKKNYNEARSAFEKLIEEFPHSELRGEAELRVTKIKELVEPKPKPETTESGTASKTHITPIPEPPKPDPDHQVAAMYKEALDLRQQGKIHDALQRYTNLITRFSDNHQYVTDAYVDIAEIYLEAEDYVNARANYEEAMYSTNDGARKIEIYKKYQLTYLIPAYVDGGRKANDRGNVQLFIEATRLRKEGKFKEAAKLYEKLANSKISAENITKALYWTGYCYHKAALSDPTLFRKAVDAFDMLISDYSNKSHTIEAYYYLALVYTDWAQTPGYSLKWQLVINKVEEAAKKYVNSDDARNRGWLSRMQELKELAIQKLNISPKPDPDTDTASKTGTTPSKGNFVDQGYTYLKRGELKIATQRARQALRINPYDRRAHELLLEIKETYYGRGWTFFDEKQYNKAIDAFKDALNIESRFKEAHCHLGVIYIEQEKYTEAIKALETAIKIDPRFKEAHFNLALAHLKLGEFQNATIAANAALKIDPNYEPAQILIDFIAN